MAGSVALFHKIHHIRVDSELKEVLWAMLEEIEHSREQSVTKTDFSELKTIVSDLAQAQQRTELRVEELAQAQRELAETQKDMSSEVARLAHQVDRLVHQVDRVTKAVEITNSQVGGLGRSMAYALENEAYRRLPAYLAARHQFQVTQRFIRTEVGGKEINFFAHARRRDGEDVVIVGESVLKLDDRSKLGQLEDAVAAARQTTSLPIIPLVVTHYASPYLIEKTRAEGILVVQSFEWDALEQEEQV